MSRPITIRFGELEDALEKRARLERRSVADIVRDAVRQYLTIRSPAERRRQREFEILAREIAILKGYTTGIAGRVLTKELVAKAAPQIEAAAVQKARELRAELDDEEVEHGGSKEKFKHCTAD